VSSWQEIICVVNSRASMGEKACWGFQTRRERHSWREDSERFVAHETKEVCVAELVVYGCFAVCFLEISDERRQRRVQEIVLEIR